MKKLKALLINGSPRAKGCTYTALTELKNTLEQEGMEVALIHVGHKDVHGCIACRKCKEIGKCVFDDIVNEVAPKFSFCYRSTCLLRISCRWSNRIS